MKIARHTVVLLVLLLASPLWAGRSFNGTSDFITIAGNGTAIDITGQAISIAAWVYIPVVSTTTQQPIAKADTGATQYEIYYNEVGQPTKTLGQYLRQSTSLNHDVYMNCASQAPVGWNQTTSTYSSVRTTWFFFCNGIQAANGTTGAGATIQSNGDNLLIGKKASTSPTFFNGYVAELAIWNVALTQGQAAALGTICPVGPSARRMGFPAPVGYYHFAGVKSPEPDESGNANNATISSGTTASNHAPCTP